MFMPKVDDLLTIQLPGEKIRATVKRIIDNDAILVELTYMPMAKSHQFKIGDVVACRRVQNVLWGESWVAQIPKPYAILPDLTQVKPDAISAGEKPEGDFGKHPRTSSPRNKKKKQRADRRDSVLKRKKTPKGKGRRSGAT